MSRDWNAKWKVVDAEYYAEQARAREALADATGLGRPLTRQEVEGLEQANKRFQAATKRRSEEIDARQKAEPGWSPPLAPV